MSDLPYLISASASRALQLYIGVILISRAWCTASRWTGAAAVSAVGVLVSTVLCILGLCGKWDTVACIAILAVGAYRLCGLRATNALFLSLCYIAAIDLWVFLAAAGLAIICDDPVYPEKLSPQYVSAVWIVTALLPVSLKVRSEKAPGWGAVAGLFLVISVSEQNGLHIDEGTCTLWTIAASLLVAANVVNRAARTRDLEAALRRAEMQRIETLQREYATLKDNYTAHAHLFHDLGNHLNALHRYLMSHDTAHALEYVNALRGNATDSAPNTWTGDDAVDYLIDYKVRRAESLGIRPVCDIEFPRNTNLQASDLVAIFGNMLDNGIDAAQGAPDELRFINIKSRVINSMVVIKQVNGYGISPENAANGQRTTKDNPDMHGYGLHSAAAAAERYDGALVTDWGDGIFRTLVTLTFSSSIPRAQ